ncbi:NifB/NifX family molybdenum-iron cluster-binding protein [Peptococcaceae bacterium 1198_IL3148]
MKIAISSLDESINSNLNPRFGRCEYFIIYDCDSGNFTAVENSGRLSTGGAGIATAKMVADLGVKVIITGLVGPKAFTALKAAGIKVYTANEGKILELIEQYKNNQLKEVNTANSGAHSGM